MTIRKAKKEDRKQIVGLCQKYKGIIMFPLPSYKKYYVAEEKGKIIGCCALDVYSKKIAEIRSLAVLPEYRKKGIGTKLVKACCKEGEKIKEIFTITGVPNYFKKLKFDFYQGEKYILFNLPAKNKQKTNENKNSKS